MPKVYYIVTMAVLLVSTALFTSFVFIPTLNPYEIVNIEVSNTPVKNDIPLQEEEQPPTLQQILQMEEGTTKIMKAEILNGELPDGWMGKEIYFKYTYIGQYSEETQKTLDNLLLDEYKWQKQLDEQGNIVMGGIILSKDDTLQLHPFYLS